jgi:hypothetical protein
MQSTSMKQALDMKSHYSFLHIGSLLCSSSALNTEAIYLSETSIVLHRATRHYIPEAITLHNHRCENLKSYNVKYYIPLYLCLTN